MNNRIKLDGRKFKAEYDLDDMFANLDEYLTEEEDIVLVKGKGMYVMVGVDYDKENNKDIYFRVEGIEEDYSEEFHMNKYPNASMVDVFLKLCEAIDKTDIISDYLDKWYKDIEAFWGVTPKITPKQRLTLALDKGRTLVAEICQSDENSDPELDIFVEDKDGTVIQDVVVACKGEIAETVKVNVFSDETSEDNTDTFYIATFNEDLR